MLGHTKRPDGVVWAAMAQAALRAAPAATFTVVVLMVVLVVVVHLPTARPPGPETWYQELNFCGRLAAENCALFYAKYIRHRKTEAPWIRKSAQHGDRPKFSVCTDENICAHFSRVTKYVHTFLGP